MSEATVTDYDSDDSWFLAQVKPNCVHISDRNLTRQGFKTFLPMEETTKKRYEHFVSALRPVFPGYIFVSFDVTRGLWRKINSTYGISHLVSFGRDPRPVPLDVISQLRERCDAEGKLLPPKILKPGDKVRFTKGPFAEFVTTIDQITPDKRIWVLFNIMGSQTSVSVSADHLSIA